jgi:SAM-dependent methyltransferase
MSRDTMSRMSADRVDLYSAYSHFTDPVSDAVRKETFGVDIGQNSWMTVDEFDRLLGGLNLNASHHILEIASGSGGPAMHLARTTGCRVRGIDSNASAVATASQTAAKLGVADRVQFGVADANARLPFDDGSFDAIVCIDAMNHFPDRLSVLREWHRVLRPGGRALFTDPVVITGPVTNDELVLRSSIGFFLFVPPGVNERLIEQAGFRLVRQEDVTDNAALIADRWRRARHAHKEELLAIEGAERFEGLQRFFEAVHTLTSQRRLSRIAYLAEKHVG